jgi:hypothetical protein
MIIKQNPTTPFDWELNSNVFNMFKLGKRPLYCRDMTFRNVAVAVAVVVLCLWGCYGCCYWDYWSTSLVHIASPDCKLCTRYIRESFKTRGSDTVCTKPQQNVQSFGNALGRSCFSGHP